MNIFNNKIRILLAWFKHVSTFLLTIKFSFDYDAHIKKPCTHENCKKDRSFSIEYVTFLRSTECVADPARESAFCKTSQQQAGR